jgi:dolichol-phosphate mannosyltransferase
MPLKTLVIVPTYNEVGNVESLAQRLFADSPSAHLLFVDDNSQDGTRDVLARLTKEDPKRIHLIERPGKLGLGTAYVEGFNWALKRDYEAIVEMDADHSHDPRDVRRMVESLARADAVIGSRWVEGGGTENWGLIRKVISRGGSLYGRLILQMNLQDLTGGFNAWRRTVLETINIQNIESRGYAFQIELKYRTKTAGFRIVEIPIVFTERRAGQSKMSGWIVVEAMLRVWKLRMMVRSFPRLSGTNATGADR